MNRRLHQKRIRDGAGGLPGLTNIARARDAHGHQSGGSLASPDDAEGELAADVAKAADELWIGRLVNPHAAGAAGQREYRVVRRALHRPR